MNKYILFIPKSGINDCFVSILKTISYCKKNKRTLLLDMTNSLYNINFSDYFFIKKLDCDIIYDSNEIKNIILCLENSNCLTVHPNNLDFNLIDLFNKTNKISFRYKKGLPCCLYNNIQLNLPVNCKENVILHSRVGGGRTGYLFFKNLILRENIKYIIKKKLILLKDNYLCIQVRNTDIKCDYKQLYENNKDYIHTFDKVYICTDDKYAYDFFKSKNLNIFCFTTFPEKSHRNLHSSNVASNTKMIDLLSDIFIATNSKSILSNSKGGFINLLKTCHKNKECILSILSSK